MIAWTNGCHGETEFPVQLFFKSQVLQAISHIEVITIQYCPSSRNSRA